MAQDRAGGGASDGGGRGGDDSDGEYGDEVSRRIALLEGDASLLRSMTSLNIGEARDLYREAASAADAQAGGRAGGGRRSGGDGGERAASLAFPPFGTFLMAVALVRKNDEALVDFVFRARPGTARAALDAVLPSLLGLRSMPRKFARRLVPFGYKAPAHPRAARESGSILDYVGRD